MQALLAVQWPLRSHEQGSWCPPGAWKAPHEGGQWQDPKYALHQVQFGPVSSMTYWDERCGVKFSDARDLVAAFEVFWQGVEAGTFAPREMILQRLRLEDRAGAYLKLADKYA